MKSPDIQPTYPSRDGGGSYSMQPLVLPVENRFLPFFDASKPPPAFLTPTEIERRNQLAKVEAEMGPIARLTVPVHFLHGIKGPGHFKYRSLKHVDGAYREYKDSSQMLKTSPIEAVFFPYADGGCAAIIQGHHRARRAPKNGVTVAPTLVLTLAQGARLLNLSNEYPTTGPYTEETLMKDLVAWTTIARQEFLQAGMPDVKEPHIISGARSVKDLPRLYPELIKPF
ncbi:MAG: hypothetical protein HYV40_03550 [Candidatus Levybacteria bacterium]|nr:hypothetical protein [Candidatus Levybacteria bacterium]